MTKPKDTTKQAAAVNMTRQYKKELRTVNTELRKVSREYRTVQRATLREISRLSRSEAKALRGLDKQADRLIRRRSILEGRLS